MLDFLKQEDGAQVIEYALIIALISIALVVALQPTVIGNGFTVFINRVVACLSAGACV